ncbi:MAG: GNAT family N-acetyltransferase [Myxococcales bacterium]|nr:GNAT family N-acetyltransferase [Myxococcales bacterium]
MVFEEPHAGLADSYRALVREFLDAGEPLVPFVLAIPADDFGEFLGRLAACARGEGLPPGFVPHSTYWLVDDGDVVAVSNLRHALTDALRNHGGNIGYGVRPSARRRGFATRILAFTLDRAHSLGLDEALLTCAKSNEGSIRAIQRNGGVLVSEEFVADRGDVVQRWRIGLGAGAR